MFCCVVKIVEDVINKLKKHKQIWPYREPVSAAQVRVVVISVTIISCIYETFLYLVCHAF